MSCLTTPIYHTNITFDGNVCLSLLKEGWNPTFGISSILIGIGHLFHAPNPYDPLPNRGCLPENYEASDLLLKDEKKFRDLVHTTLKGGYVDQLKKTFQKLI